MLDSLRQELGRRPGVSPAIPSKIHLILPSEVPASFVKAFRVRLVEWTTQPWEYWFGLLLRYRDEHGHLNVPIRHIESGERLGQWVNVQRSRRATLLADRRERLDALDGWIWDAHDDAWERGFESLSRFVDREGHSRVPAGYRDDRYGLGQWVTHQRSRRDSMAADQRRRLEALAKWSWDVLTDVWEEHLEALNAFARREGHARVPPKHVEQDLTLGRWVAKQRTLRTTMPEDRRTRLEAVDGWVWHANDAKWEDHFSLLVEFCDREGHARVPRGYVVDSKDLGKWVTVQRHAKGRLPRDRFDRLESLDGWVWNVLDAQWEDAFALLLSFAKREGHAQVPNNHLEAGYKLGSWVYIQRANREGMSAERRKRLEAVPGWVWRAR